jgi:FkbM family methyltransferase
MSITRRVVRLLVPYGSKRRVLRGPAKGMLFIAEPGIGFSYAVGARAAAPRFFARWVRPGATVYDVGSNKGQMALIFAALVGPSGRVLAFEPVPAEYTSLVRNLRLNGLANVRCIEAAVSDQSGELPFAYSPDRPTEGKLHGVEKSYGNTAVAETLSVPAISLDDILQEEPAPDVLKIDVEGAAASVLRGARRIIQDVSPAIYLELHGPEEQAGVRDELVTRGYVARTLSGTIVPDPTSGWHSPLWCSRPGSRNDQNM